jgi:hypothetical protein
MTVEIHPAVAFALLLVVLYYVWRAFDSDRKFR